MWKSVDSHFPYPSRSLNYQFLLIILILNKMHFLVGSNSSPDFSNI